VLPVSITNSSPRGRRKLSAPGNCTLGDIRVVIQTAFGWHNGHLHSFTINSTEYGITDEYTGLGDDFEGIDEDAVCLCHLDLQPKKKFRYLYDFGDSWMHGITVPGSFLSLPKTVG
jgi:hypothetical protein